jgi:hypothetical protein
MGILAQMSNRRRNKNTHRMGGRTFPARRAAGTASPQEESSLLRCARLILGRFDIRMSPLLSSLGSSVGEARRLPWLAGKLDLLSSAPLLPLLALVVSLLPPASPLSLVSAGSRADTNFDRSSRSVSFHVRPPYSLRSPSISIRTPSITARCTKTYWRKL